MTSLKKTVYIPIEIKAREFASQVLLASELVRRGARVYIGSKGQIFSVVRDKPRKAGTLLYKGGMGGEHFKKMKRNLNAIAVLDQEASPAMLDFRKSCSRFTHDELRFVDRLYYCSKKISDYVVAAHPLVANGKTRVLGWPRIDLWTDKYRSFWDDELSVIKKRFQSYVLLSSDFGVLSDEDVAWRIKQVSSWNYDTGAKPDLRELEVKLHSRVEEFRAMVQWIRELDGEPRMPPIVVRPHPSENHSHWKLSLKGLKKTKVIFEGDITPWLLGSKGLLHRGCTTALQATVMGKRVGMLVTSSNNLGPRESQMRKFSKSLFNTDEICNFFGSESGFVANELSDDMIAMPEEGAASLIADDLLALTTAKEAPYIGHNFTTFHRAIKNPLKIINRVLNIKSGKESGGIIPPSVQRNKLPGGITSMDVTSLLRRFDPKHKYHITQVRKNCVAIEGVIPISSLSSECNGEII